MATVAAKTLDDILTVAEIERRYPDEWVLVEITQAHKHHQRVKGRLLAHSPNRDDLDEPTAACGRSARRPTRSSFTPASSCAMTWSSFCNAPRRPCPVCSRPAFGGRTRHLE